MAEGEFTDRDSCGNCYNSSWLLSGTASSLAGQVNSNLIERDKSRSRETTLEAFRDSTASIKSRQHFSCDLLSVT